MKLATIRRASSRRSDVADSHGRQRILAGVFLAGFFLICVRLGYWQIIRASELTQEAEGQYNKKKKQSGQRGTILFQDHKPLVINTQVYRWYSKPDLLSSQERDQIITAALPLYQRQHPDDPEWLQSTKDRLHDLLDSDSRKWAEVIADISEEDKAALSALAIPNTGFEAYETRYYPEASMAAHITGFVGKNADGQPTGYFGLEGALDQELDARSLSQKVVTDALGFSLSSQDGEQNLDGRTFVTTLRRDVQQLLERKLHEGMLKYGPVAGEVIVLEPKTGNILGMASEPTYDQAKYSESDQDTFANPSLSETYEPGSTFKVLTVAAGIDSGVIPPDTTCDRCSGPRTFGKYQIKTWNEEYHPNITMSEALAKSDNVAMIFVAEKIGSDRFCKYLQDFGIGSPIGLELEEDSSTPFPDDFHPVELATASFGQGISTNSLQLVRAVATIANQGTMMQPHILSSIYDPITGTSIDIQPEVVRQVVSPETAQAVTQMMIYSAQHGEAQWTYRPNHTVSGKTGTSQVAIKGGYDESKTIASFIGFAPSQKPAFVMLVKLTAPSSSIWAAETAAPLWYDIAEELYLLLQIPPDR